VVPLVENESVAADDCMLATWVPANAEKRNIVVPANYPMAATKSIES
jgi:hypothetical protein